MRNLFYAICLMGLLALGVAAQDDAESEEDPDAAVCEMLALYELVQYSDEIDDEKKSNYKLQGLVLGLGYPQCNEPAPQSEPDRRLPVTAVLENDEWYELEAVGCQAIVTAVGELNFQAAVIGERLEGLSVDVYFAGESQKAEMDQTLYMIDKNDPPGKVIGKYGKVFPLGVYYFDVTIDGKTFRLQWNREGKAYRFFALECLDRQRDANLPMALQEDAWYFLGGDECMLRLDQVGENFNVLTIGEKLDRIFVDVTLPGENAPAAFDGEGTDLMIEGYPVNHKWIAGEIFPTGRYEIVVTIEGDAYEFAWERKDHQYDSLQVGCFPDGR
ncbi:MAG: hypothetical protein OXG53_03915 [Chloroflexi bacterium]|nr:hypothetical protein [Chloroflexota bacterium]